MLMLMVGIVMVLMMLEVEGRASVERTAHLLSRLPLEADGMSMALLSGVIVLPLTAGCHSSVGHGLRQHRIVE